MAVNRISQKCTELRVNVINIASTSQFHEFHEDVIYLFPLPLPVIYISFARHCLNIFADNKNLSTYNLRIPFTLIMDVSHVDQYLLGGCGREGGEGEGGWSLL